jgi:O-Antigen ligase
MSSEVFIERNVPRRPVILWPATALPLSALIIWAVSEGGNLLRSLMLGGLTVAMTLPLLFSLEAGLMAMMLFEPFRGFLRRAQYLLVPYSQTDPIHMVTPFVTMLAFVMVFHRRRLRMFQGTPLTKLVSILALVYFLQIFNPLQGGLAIGLTGAMFMLVPVAWFYFGQEVHSRFMATTLRVLVALGLIASLYGLYHLLYGFPSFEQYWLDHTDAYESIALGQIKRALATFSSAEEWGRYIEISALAAFAFCAGAVGVVRRGGWFLCGGALSIMLIFTGQRTALFGTFVGVVALFVLGAATWRAAGARLALAFAPVLLIGFLATAPSGDDVWSLGEEERFEAALTHTARGALHPTKEDSLHERFDIWTSLATDIIPNNPLGMGLGATSLAAHRVEGRGSLPPLDSYFVASVVTCGLPAALLFIWILVKAMLISWRRFYAAPRGSSEAQVWRALSAILPALILNSFFGNTFTLYSVAPLGWLMLGWISMENRRQTEKRELMEI